MENFNEIKSLWQAGEPYNLPQFVEIEGIISQYNKKIKNKNLLAIVLLICILIILFLLLSFVAIKMWTTYFGIILWIGVAFYSIYLKIKRQTKLSDLEMLSNNEFLVAHEKEENQICVGKSKNQALLFIMWAIGFSFYIYEPISDSASSLIIGYGSLVIYIIVVWFFYMPFMTKRYQKSIQKTITHIKRLKSQIHENK